MKMHALMVLALAALASVGCSSGGNGATPDVDQDDVHARAAIDTVRTEYVEAWMAADAARVADLYSEDAVVLYPNHAAIVGRPAIRDYFTTFFRELTPEHFQLVSDEIQIAGAWAFDRGSYQLHAAPSAGRDPIDDQGKYLVILQRQADGSWQVARDMDNSNGRAAPNTDEAD